MPEPPHVKQLPPAEEVEHAPYELRSLQAPVLRGLSLDMFLTVYESSLGYYLYPILGRQSGVSQVPLHTLIICVWSSATASDVGIPFRLRLALEGRGGAGGGSMQEMLMLT